MTRYGHALILCTAKKMIVTNVTSDACMTEKYCHNNMLFQQKSASEVTNPFLQCGSSLYTFRAIEQLLWFCRSWSDTDGARPSDKCYRTK
jgi:hypothetical protein